MVLNFEFEKLEEELKSRKPSKVLVQLPEGIKQNAFDVKAVFDKEGVEVIFSGETAWGGCSIAVDEARNLGVDLIVHFGHAKFIPNPGEIPILYIEVKDELDLKPILEKSLEKLKDYKKIGLSYSIQHRHDIESIKKFYEDAGLEVMLSNRRGFAEYTGHVIGCEFTGLKEIQEEVDAFVIIGNQFHSMGAVLAVKKPVILVDVYNDDVRSMEGVRDKILKQRIISIEKFKDSRRIGVLVENKPGQKFGSSKYVLSKLKEKGYDAILISISEITPDKIANFYNVDAFVSLACPRIAVDDFSKYPRPMITFKELLVALGEKSYEEMEELGFI